MTRKAFLALCASVLAAPFVTKPRVVEWMRNDTPIVPKPPDMPRWTFHGVEITPDLDVPQWNTLYMMTKKQEDLFRRIADGERLYGLGTWETHKGDAQ